MRVLDIVKESATEALGVSPALVTVREIPSGAQRRLMEYALKVEVSVTSEDEEFMDQLPTAVPLETLQTTVQQAVTTETTKTDSVLSGVDVVGVSVEEPTVVKGESDDFPIAIVVGSVAGAVAAIAIAVVVVVLVRRRGHNQVQAVQES